MMIYDDGDGDYHDVDDAAYDDDDHDYYCNIDVRIIFTL